MAKEMQESTPASNKTDHVVKSVVDVITVACKQPGGLPLKVSKRGRRDVNETIMVNEANLNEVRVGADYTVTVEAGNRRFLPPSREANCALVRHALLCAQNQCPEDFSFGISFITTSEEELQPV